MRLNDLLQERNIPMSLSSDFKITFTAHCDFVVDMSQLNYDMIKKHTETIDANKSIKKFLLSYEPFTSLSQDKVMDFITMNFELDTNPAYLLPFANKDVIKDILNSIEHVKNDTIDYKNAIMMASLRRALVPLGYTDKVDSHKIIQLAKQNVNQLKVIPWALIKYKYVYDKEKKIYYDTSTGSKSDIFEWFGMKLKNNSILRSKVADYVHEHIEEFISSDSIVELIFKKFENLKINKIADFTYRCEIGSIDSVKDFFKEFSEIFALIDNSDIINTNQNTGCHISLILEDSNEIDWFKFLTIIAGQNAITKLKSYIGADLIDKYIVYIKNNKAYNPYIEKFNKHIMPKLGNLGIIKFNDLVDNNKISIIPNVTNGYEKHFSNIITTIGKVRNILILSSDNQTATSSYIKMLT